MTAGAPRPLVVAAAAAGALAALVGGAYLAASPYAVVAFALLAALGVLVAPAHALLAWSLALLASGRQVTRLNVWPELPDVYITEAILLLFLIAFGARVVAQGRRLGTAVKVAAGLSALLLVPAAGGVLLHTHGDGPWVANAAIVGYALFALVGAAVAPTRSFFRRLAVTTLVGSTAALVLVGAGGAGAAHAATSTGVARLAHGSFSIPFGLAPLVLLALVRERHVRPLWGVAGALPFLGALVLVNHRSAWVAFAAAGVPLLVGRLNLRLVTAATLAALVAIALADRELREPESLVAQEVARAQSIGDLDDPNIRFRLDYWAAVARSSAGSPLIGRGFDPYPEDLIPPTTVGDGRLDPHNSFVALMYRVGVVPAAAVVLLLIVVVARGCRVGWSSPDPAMRAAALALSSAVVYLGVFSAFNVGLEVPYTAVPFWLAVGLLLAATLRARGR